MLSTGFPYKFSVPWGNSAPSNLITNPIPLTSVSPAASQTLGWPLATATPVGAGGNPPNVADDTGAHFYTTSWLQFLQAGGQIPWDSAFSTAIGGYPNNAIIQSSSATFHWQSTVDNNASDPDTGGGNWIREEGGSFPRRIIGVATSGTWTGTSTGTLIYIGAGGTTQTINVSTLLPGDALGFKATGFACTVTLSSGSFQGGSLTGLTSITIPIQSYVAFSFDGTDCQIFSIGATLDIGTLSGVLTGTLPSPGMASGAAATNIGTVGGVLTGTLPNPGMATNAAATNVGTVGGDLAGTLPNPTIKSSVNLTGTPTAPSAALGTSTTQIATTSFANPGAGSDPHGNFYGRPDGTVEMWGTYSGSIPQGASVTVTLPNGGYASGITGIWVTPIVSSGTEDNQSAVAFAVDNQHITIGNTGRSGGPTFPAYWRTLGR